MDPVIAIIISLCMALLFGFAATHKLRAPGVFKATMDEYQLIPEPISGLISSLLIAMELLAAILLLVPAARETGLVLVAVLLVVYTGGISINLLRGRRDIDCGCSGPASRHELSGWLVFRNLVLLGLVLLALGWSAQRPLNWLDNMVIVFSVSIASGLYMGLNQLLARAPRMAELRAGS